MKKAKSELNVSMIFEFASEVGLSAFGKVDIIVIFFVRECSLIEQPEKRV